MKHLLIGQAPSRKTDGQAAFTGDCGRRIAAMMGLSHEVMLSTLECVNVFERWPGAAGRGDNFPMKEARLRAAAFDIEGRRVIFVGSAVSRAFGLAKIDPLIWIALRGATVALLPHPSGLNTWYNDPAHKAAAAVFMRNLPL